MTTTDYDRIIAEQYAFILALAERIYICFEILSRLAEKRKGASM